MLFTRGNLVRQAGGALARAATIAVRYSGVRRQGFSGDATSGHAGPSYAAPECVLLDHQMQRARLLRQLAAAYAIKFTGAWLLQRFSAMEGGDAGGAISAVPADLSQLAASTAGLKALTTVRAADGIEQCRRCCGGAGYLLASGIGALYGDYVWWVTAEGDEVVMQLQLARFLVKSLRAFEKATAASGVRVAAAGLPAELAYLATTARDDADDAAAQGTSQGSSAAWPLGWLVGCLAG